MNKRQRESALDEFHRQAGEFERLAAPLFRAGAALNDPHLAGLRNRAAVIRGIMQTAIYALSFAHEMVGGHPMIERAGEHVMRGATLALKWFNRDAHSLLTEKRQ